MAKALGYKNPSKALSDHCKGVTKRYTPTSSGKQEMNFITEGDIYRLAAKSELPGADRFESWIFDEVLRIIRKTGSYSIKPMTDYQQQSLRIQRAKLLNQIAGDYDGTYKMGYSWRRVRMAKTCRPKKHEKINPWCFECPLSDCRCKASVSVCLYAASMEAREREKQKRARNPMAWALQNEDFSDLTMPEIAEVFGVAEEVIRNTMLRIFKKTGYRVPYVHRNPGRKRKNVAAPAGTGTAQ